MLDDEAGFIIGNRAGIGQRGGFGQSANAGSKRGHVQSLQMATPAGGTGFRPINRSWAMVTGSGP